MTFSRESACLHRVTVDSGYLRRFFGLLSGLMLLSSIPSFGQGGGPLGGGVTSIVIDLTNPAVLYIGTGVGGAFKTTNGGATWTSITTVNFSRFVRELAIDPANDQTIYAATAGLNGGVFKSVDGAASWTLANTGIGSTNVIAVAVDPVSTSTIYAGVPGIGVFKSVNAASTWNLASTGLTNVAIQSITIDPSNSAVLYVGTNGGGVFKSTDGGAHWSAMITGLTNLGVLAVAVDPNNPAVVYTGTNGGGAFKSTNGGVTWGAVNSGLNPVVLSVRRIAIDHNDSNIVYAATFTGVFKSVNGGASWIAANSGVTVLEKSVAPGAFDVVIDPSNSSTVYLATQSEGAVFRSTNGGGSWTALNAGITASQISAVVIDPSNPTTVYAATTSNAIYKSADGGASWFEANLGFTTLLTLSLAIDPNTTTTLYAGTMNRGFGEGVFKSTNGGSSWTRVGFGVVSPVRKIEVDPSNSSVIYAATFGSGIYKSTNAGATWTQINSGLSDTNVQDLVLDPLNSAVAYAGTASGLFKTTNSGSTWVLSDAGLTNTDVLALAVDPVTTSTVYAGTNGGIFKSANGAGSWSASSSGISAPQIIHTIAIDPSHPLTLYVGKASFGLVYKSTDGGVTWTNLSSGLPTFPTFLSTLAVDPSTPNNIYAGTDSTGIFKSTIGGGTWQPTGIPIPICTFFFTPSGQGFGPQGGTASFGVTTGPTCSWSAIPSASWISILPGGGSKGPGRVNYNIGTDVGGARAGSISVGGQQFNINQQGFSCVFQISPSGLSLGNSGGGFSAAVLAPGGCAWTAVSNVPWITVLSGSSGSGGGRVFLLISPNGGAFRTGTVTIAGQTFSVAEAPGGGGGGGGVPACGALDVTSQVSVSRLGFTPIPPAGSNLYDQEITISNTGRSPIGPVYYVLLGLPTPSGTGLASNFPLTHCFSSKGDSIVLVSGGLLPGAHVKFGLTFVGEPSYTDRVLSGTPSK